MKRILDCCILLCLPVLIFVVACEAEPTATPTRVPTRTLQGTAAPRGTTAPLPTRDASPAVTAAPTRRFGPGGSIVIAGVGQPSREISALPEFVSNALYDSLLRVDPKTGDLIPGLAEQWLVSDDAKTFVFVLREGVKWHDGSPLTADDVVFTLKALSDPDVRVNPAADFGPIDEIAATDDRTVSVTFTDPYCAALTHIGQVKILPQHLLDGKDLANVSNEDLIGTGPLVLQDWDGDTLTFARNAAYWNGPPQIVDWTYQSFPSAVQAQAAVRDGQANVLVERVTGTDTEGVVFPASEFYALAMNTERFPFEDSSTRQAVAAALNVEQIAAEANGTALTSSLLPGYWANSRNLAGNTFDPTRAKRLLTEAGWRDADGDGILDKDGKPFEVTLWAQSEEPLSEQSAQRIRQQLEQVGIRAILKLTDRTLFLTRLFLHEFDLALAHYNLPLDPDQHYFWASSEIEPGAGLNVTGYTNAAVDAALASGNSVERCEPTARKNAYAPMFQQLVKDTPMVMLFAPSDALRSNQDVEGPAPSAFAGAYWNLNKWQVAQQ